MLTLAQHRLVNHLVPAILYAGFVISAFLIGREHSCEPVANLYYWGGMLSLPLLFALPFQFCAGRSLPMRVFVALLDAGLGIAIWAWAYDAAGMVLMCRLF